MRAAVAEQPGQPVVIQDLPVPEPGPGEVALNIKACGVCYTDLRIIDALGAAAMPLVPGHEPVGIVTAVGPGVVDVKVGDRVGAHALFTCGDCAYCRAGEEEACVTGMAGLAGLGKNGGYAEYMAMPASHAIPLPPAMDFAEAAPFLCAGLTTYAGLKNGGIEPGKRVVILGIGGLGHLAIPIARALGAEVYAVTGTESKAQMSRELGAAVAGDATTVVAALQAAGGAHLVLNTANSLGPVGQVLPAMAKQGTIVLTAADGNTFPVPPGAFVGLQLRVVGSFFGSRQDLREVLDLAATHGIRPTIERYPLADVATAHARLRQNLVRYRAVLEP
ncbi:MAG: alcohol dehydrogenase catalytic domain-containing protein [Dehalococcoidia bacterium]